MEREYRPVTAYYFGIYVDPDPDKRRYRLEVNNIGVRKSERNQIIADQRKAERRLGLSKEQLTDVERAIIRAQRQERLAGVTLYVRNAVSNHSKGLIPKDN